LTKRKILLAALIAALAGYFGPWVWHPAVAFRYSADDLAEFVKLMPAVRSGEVLITRELFYLPMWMAAVGLALWVGAYVQKTWARWLVGLVVGYAAVWPMPSYPFILDAYRSPEFGLTFWVSVVTVVLCALAAWRGARLPRRGRGALWIAIGSIGATVAPLHFVRLKPALDAQHGWMMSLGWGIVVTVAAFVVIGAIGFLDARRSAP
jgi:ABC-type glycerol-3-phosphate transport system permease component